MTARRAQARTRPVQARGQAPEREHPFGTGREPQDAPQGAQGLSAAQLLTAEQLAERWQVPKSQVYRLTRRGDIPVVELGAYYRYRIEDIEAFEKEGGTDA